MRERFIKISAGALVLAAVIGWLQAGPAVVDVTSAADPWQDLSAGENVGELDAISERLKLSGLFPLSQAEADKRAALIAQNPAEGAGGVPAFPTIIAVSTLGGLPQVHLRLADNQNIVAGAGETLVSGWTLKMIDLERVIAVYEGQEQEFKVVNYESQVGHEEKENPGNQ